MTEVTDLRQLRFVIDDVLADYVLNALAQCTKPKPPLTAGEIRAWIGDGEDEPLGYSEVLWALRVMEHQGIVKCVPIKRSTGLQPGWVLVSEQ